MGIVFVAVTVESTGSRNFAVVVSIFGSFETLYLAVSSSVHRAMLVCDKCRLTSLRCDFWASLSILLSFHSFHLAPLERTRFLWPEPPLILLQNISFQLHFVKLVSFEGLKLSL